MYDILTMKSIAQELNNRTYTDYYYRLMLLAKSVFKWENLPNNMDEKWIENFLFTEGRCMFFHDEILGFMVAKCNDSGSLNEYDEPTLIEPSATNYIKTEPLKNGKDAVIIRNNDIELPSAPTIQLYAFRLSELTRTIDVNIQAQKTPILVLCSEKQKLSMKQVYAKYTGNEPFIFGTKDLDIEGVKVLKTDAPFVADKLQYQKHALWNECMTFLGINNANQDKRERLVDDEVQANNEQIEQSAEIMLKARERAVEQINKLFGLNIKVSLRKIDTSKLQAHIGISEDGQNAIGF